MLRRKRHTLTGVWVEILTTQRTLTLTKSHPHGCVSWNEDVERAAIIDPSHPHGCVSWNPRSPLTAQPPQRVTPSRVCELKSVICRCEYRGNGHTLTGVWVEILFLPKRLIAVLSHPHGCVSWNQVSTALFIGRIGHTLTGVWVEILRRFIFRFLRRVTPSRVCELKYQFGDSFRKRTVTPSRVCELKCRKSGQRQRTNGSHPHGCVSWNIREENYCRNFPVTPSRVCELKCLSISLIFSFYSHTLTGVWVEITSPWLLQAV